MANVLPYAQRHPREEVRYADFPAWLYPSNCGALVLAFVGFAVNLVSSADFLVGLLCALLVIPHFMLLVLPSLWQVLFAERVSPWDRAVATVMIIAGFSAVLFVARMGLSEWRFCC